MEEAHKEACMENLHPMFDNLEVLFGKKVQAGFDGQSQQKSWHSVQNVNKNRIQLYANLRNRYFIHNRM